VNAEDHEAQREALADAIHKRMTSSYIGAPPPRLRGDAERAVWAVIHEGWQPPVTDELVDHMTRLWHEFWSTCQECPGWTAHRDEMEWILTEAAKGVPEQQEDDHE
jgi:hypothetical protein